MSHDVFISHAAADKAIADAITQTLEDGGVQCWIAPRDIRPGDTWGGSIVKAIDRRVDLVDNEIQYLELSDKLDINIKLKDKLFVFLNRVDAIPVNKFNEKINKATKELSKFCKPHRIYKGSALGELINLNEASDNFGIIDNLDKLGISTGLVEFKKGINEFLQNDRLNIIRDAMSNLIYMTKKELRKLKKIAEDHDYSPADGNSRKDLDDKIRELFVNWWLEKRNGIKERFNNWFQDKISHNIQDSVVNDRIREMEVVHLNCVNNLLKCLTQYFFNPIFIPRAKVKKQ